MKSTRLMALAASVLLLTPTAWGFLRLSFTFSDGTFVYMKRSDVTGAGAQFYINSGIVAGAQSSLSGSPVTVISSGSDPLAAIRAAIATWNGASVASIKILPPNPTSKVIDPADNQNTISIATTAADLSALGGPSGAVAVTINQGAGFTVGTTPTGDVTDTDIILNPAVQFSTDGSTATDLQSVMTHELGHALGMSHSGLIGATMFQYTEASQRYLSPDELTFGSAVYPTRAVSVGTISGKVIASDGSAVKSALVEMIDQSNGNALSALTGSDGTYSVQATPGTYVLEAEPLTGLVRAGNLYLLTSTPVTTAFQPTVLGGIGTPTPVSVTSAATVTAPTLTVTTGTSTLTTPFTGIGKANGSADIRSVQTTSIIVPSGQSVDIGMTGGGVDGTVSVSVIGQGITVHPGSVRVEPNVTFGGNPLVRVTLDVTARTNQGLATLIVTKGSNVLSLSGQLVIVPPTPVIGAVTDAESARATIVPGEWLAIYGSGLGTGVSIWGGSDFINGLFLPTSLNGVRVQFNGTPAAVYFASDGQLDVQAPSGLSGNVSVTVTNNGSPSAVFKVQAVPNAPSLFIYPAAGKTYPAAVHLSGTIVGDPASLAGTVKAKPGETIIFFVNGLDSSAGGTIIGTPVNYTNPVTLTIGSTTTTASFAGLVAAGEYQLNVTIPASLAPGDYPITVTAGGQTSASGITLSVSN